MGRARGIALEILQWFESTSERLFFGMPLREQGAPRGERENEVGSPHFFISPCPFRMRFARHWRFALLLFLHWRVRMDFAVLSQRKWKGLYHIEMSIRFPPQMRWGISHLCPFIFLKGIEARPGSRRSNNRRGAPQYTIAHSNWESYYT